MWAAWWWGGVGQGPLLPAGGSSGSGRVGLPFWSQLSVKAWGGLSEPVWEEANGPSWSWTHLISASVPFWLPSQASLPQLWLQRRFALSMLGP